MSHPTPTEPEVLRSEIARTRADLGATIEALAAKTDVAARGRDAVSGLTGHAKDTVRAVGDRLSRAASDTRDSLAHAAGAVGERTRSKTAAVRESFEDADVPTAVAKPLPIAIVAVAAAAIGLLVYLWRRRS